MKWFMIIISTVVAILVIQSANLTIQLNEVREARNHAAMAID